MPIRPPEPVRIPEEPDPNERFTPNVLMHLSRHLQEIAQLPDDATVLETKEAIRRLARTQRELVLHLLFVEDGDESEAHELEVPRERPGPI